MIALVAERPGVLSVQERPVPVPGDGEAVVAVAYSGICHTDHYVLNGRHPAVSYPVVPGHEFGGTVAGTRGRVRGLSEGDRVAVHSQLGCGHCRSCQDGEPRYCRTSRQLGSTHDGGWQSYITLPLQALFRVPGTVSLQDAALVEPAANGHAAVRSAAIMEGEVVAIIGPGPIGLMALQFARLQKPGLIVLIGTERDTWRLETGRRLGASHVIAGTGDAVAQVMELTGGNGTDVTIQCAGSVAGFQLALDLALPRRARVVVEGYAGSTTLVPVSPDRLAAGEKTIRGVNGWSTADFRAALDHVAAGSVQLGPLMTHVFAPTDCEHAIATAMEHPDQVVKTAFAFAAETEPKVFGETSATA